MITADDGLRLAFRIWLGKNEDMDQNATAKDNLDAEVASKQPLLAAKFIHEHF